MFIMGGAVMFLSSSKDLMVKVVQNIPTMLVYLPPQLSVCSQVSSR